MSVEPQSHSKDLPSTWDSYKWAHLEAIAQYLELYPDFDLYFLARDAELLYDLAKLATQDQPEVQSRLHLLNISRANMKAENVKDYLAQNGISAENLSSGKKIMFIDTGFSGTIPRVITSYFPGHEAQLKTHLLTSSNSSHPSTRSFLYYLNQMAAEVSPSSLHGTIVSYEHMPRYTDRSDRFHFDGTRWHPTSPTGSSKDGQVNPEKALKFQEDLSLFWQNDETKKVFNQRRALYQWLNQEFKAGNIVSAITQMISSDAVKLSIPDILMLDLDDTLLKEVPIEFKNHEAVQSIHYTPNPDTYAKYQARLNQATDPEKVIHYELHGDGTMTGYLTLRPVLQDVLFQLKDKIKDGSLRVLVTSANDPNRTKAVLEQVKIHGVTLNELGFEFVEPDLILENGGNKNVQKLRHRLNIPDDLRLLAIDDLADKVIGLSDKDATLKATPFDLEQVYNLLRPDQVLLMEAFNNQDVGFFKELVQTLSEPTRNLSEARLLFTDIPEGLRLAIAKDFVEALRRNFDTTIPEIVGLNFNESKTQQQSKKNEYIKKYPHLADILENPDDEIPKLFQNENWQIIGNLIDANIDQEINLILIKNLFDAEASGIKKSLQESMIEKGDKQVLINLASSTFSQPHTKNMTDLIKILIEKGDQVVLRGLASSTFSKPHTQNMTDLLRLVIEKGDHEVLRELAHSTFSKPHTQNMTDLIKILIEKGDQVVLRGLASSTFSKPHTQNMTDLLRLVIEKGDHEVLRELAHSTFSKPHTQNMTDLLRLVIEKGDQKVLSYLASSTFSKPHTQNMTDLLRLVIEKGDQLVLRYLAEHTFSQPHTQNMIDLLKLMFEKSNQGVLRDLARYTFSQPHTENMTDLLKLVIEKGDKQVLMHLAYNTFSKPHTKDMTDLLRLVIEKGDQSVLISLAQFTFSQAHTKDMTDLLRLVIEKGDQVVLMTLVHYTFSTVYDFGPSYQILKDSLRIRDQASRIEFLRLNLDNQELENASMCTSYLSS